MLAKKTFKSKAFLDEGIFLLLAETRVDYEMVLVLDLFDFEFLDPMF